MNHNHRYDVHAIKRTLTARGILCSVTNGTHTARGTLIVNIDPRQTDDKVYRDRMLTGAMLDTYYPNIPRSGSFFVRETRAAMLQHKPCAELGPDGMLAAKDVQP